MNPLYQATLHRSGVNHAQFTLEAIFEELDEQSALTPVPAA
ncbi:MAG: hypothetical protein WBC73_06085 [Phormidesmis sp.]